jgi:uncharacterized membrane protein HdeD (DUF308 family)
METESSPPWWIKLIEGLVAVILGSFLLFQPGATLEFLIRILGIYWLISGLVELLHMAFGRSDRRWYGSLATGIFGIAAGLVAIGYPLLVGTLGATFVLWLIGILAVVAGVLGVVRVMQGARWEVGVVGAISILLGLLLLASPILVIRLIVVIAAIAAIAGGLFAVFASFQTRRAQGTVRGY